MKSKQKRAVFIAAGIIIASVTLIVLFVSTLVRVDDTDREKREAWQQFVGRVRTEQNIRVEQVYPEQRTLSIDLPSVLHEADFKGSVDYNEQPTPVIRLDIYFDDVCVASVHGFGGYTYEVWLEGNDFNIFSSNLNAALKQALS